jgi:SecD/SecF fusion protein
LVQDQLKVTTLIGIITSLFILFARIFIDKDIAKNATLSFVTNFSKTFTNSILILKVKKWTIIFSAIVVVVSVISIFTNGLDQGGFVGG